MEAAIERLRRTGKANSPEVVVFLEVRPSAPSTTSSRVVETGSLRRMRIIYDTNIRFATARGQWEGILRRRNTMPYLRYVAVMDARTRPEHAA